MSNLGNSEHGCPSLICFPALALAYFSLKTLQTIVTTSPKNGFGQKITALRCHEMHIFRFKCQILEVLPADSLMILSPPNMANCGPCFVSAQRPSKVLGPRIDHRFPNDHLRWSPNVRGSKIWRLLDHLGSLPTESLKKGVPFMKGYPQIDGL